jgi:chemotaxis-related protein WspD
MSAPVVDDCWNRIGVRGDVSCPELTRHLHCHNCPVHAGAALALLDHEPPAGSGAAWTAHFAQPPAVVERGLVSIFVFRVAADWLALPTAIVSEVAPERMIHSLPHRQGAVLGVVNVHGALRICLSLAAILDLDVTAESVAGRRFERERMLILHHGDVTAACPVDEVSGIHRVPPSDLLEAPATSAGAGSCVARVWPWSGRTVGVLDETLVGQALRRGLA